LPFGGGAAAGGGLSMKKKYLFLCTLALCLCVGAFAVISRSYADQDSGLTSTMGKAVDSNNETARIEDWMKENSQTTDKLYAGLLAYRKSLEENPSLSSIRLPGDNVVIVNDIIPLGVPYLNEMLDMVMNQKLFDVPLMYSIEQIAGVSCKPENMSFDDYEPTHDAWRANMKDLLENAETAVKNREDISKYGIFALPYVIDDNTNKELQSYLASQSDILGKSGLAMKNISDGSTWVQDNKDLITQIRNCVNRYK
jgi:hypothetical protein